MIKCTLKNYTWKRPFINIKRFIRLIKSVLLKSHYGCIRMVIRMVYIGSFLECCRSFLPRTICPAMCPMQKWPLCRACALHHQGPTEVLMQWACPSALTNPECHTVPGMEDLVSKECRMPTSVPKMWRCSRFLGTYNSNNVSMVMLTQFKELRWSFFFFIFLRDFSFSFLVMQPNTLFSHAWTTSSLGKELSRIHTCIQLIFLISQFYINKIL